MFKQQLIFSRKDSVTNFEFSQQPWRAPAPLGGIEAQGAKFRSFRRRSYLLSGHFLYMENQGKNILQQIVQQQKKDL